MSDLPVVKTTAAAAAAFLTGNKVSPTSGGGAFIRFDSKRTGDWLFGMEGEVVTNEVFGLNLTSLKHGQILWHAKKANKKLVPINQDLPQPQEPIHFTDNKGKPQVDEANEARSFEGTFEDATTFTFETSTYGGRKAVDALFAELFTRANAGSSFLFPRVKLDTNSYEHNQYGLVYEPVLVAIEWYDAEGALEPAGAELLEEKAPEPEPDPEPAPAPTRRRKRAAA